MNIENEIEIEIESGQLWSFKNTKGNPCDDYLLVIKCENRNQEIVHIVLTDKNLISKGHMPFSKSSIKKSVINLLKEGIDTNNFQEGYKEWNKHFIKGNAGVYTISVGEANELL